MNEVSNAQNACTPSLAPPVYNSIL